MEENQGDWQVIKPFIINLDSDDSSDESHIICCLERTNEKHLTTVLNPNAPEFKQKNTAAENSEDLDFVLYTNQESENEKITDYYAEKTRHNNFIEDDSILRYLPDKNSYSCDNCDDNFSHSTPNNSFNVNLPCGDNVEISVINHEPNPCISPKFKHQHEESLPSAISASPISKVPPYIYKYHHLLSLLPQQQLPCVFDKCENMCTGECFSDGDLPKTRTPPKTQTRILHGKKECVMLLPNSSSPTISPNTSSSTSSNPSEPTSTDISHNAHANSCEDLETCTNTNSRPNNTLVFKSPTEEICLAKLDNKENITTNNKISNNECNMRIISSSNVNSHPTVENDLQANSTPVPPKTERLLAYIECNKLDPCYQDSETAYNLGFLHNKGNADMDLLKREAYKVGNISVTYDGKAQCLHLPYGMEVDVTRDGDIQVTSRNHSDVIRACARNDGKATAVQHPLATINNYKKYITVLHKDGRFCRLSPKSIHLSLTEEDFCYEIKEESYISSKRRPLTPIKYGSDYETMWSSMFKGCHSHCDNPFNEKERLIVYRHSDYGISVDMSSQGVGLVWVHQSPGGLVKVTTGNSADDDDTSILVSPTRHVSITNDAQYNQHKIEIAISNTSITLKQGTNQMSATPGSFTVSDEKTKAGFTNRGEFYRCANECNTKDDSPSHDVIRAAHTAHKEMLQRLGIWVEKQADNYTVLPLSVKCRVPPVSHHWIAIDSNDQS